MNAKQNMFLIKKLVTQFDGRKSDMTEKEHWGREESITVYPKEEDPISDDSKKKRESYQWET